MLFRSQLFYTDGPDSLWHISLKSVRLDGSGTRELLSGESDIVGFFPRPDGTKAAVIGWDYTVYTTPLPAAGAPVVHLSIKANPERTRLTRISPAGGLNPRWLEDGSLLYGWMESFYRWRPQPRTEATLLAKINLTVPRPGGEGSE